MENQKKFIKEIEIELLLLMKYGWKQHPNYNYEKICDICMEDMKDKYVLETECHHSYHRECIMITFTDYGFLKCPSCSKFYKSND